MITFLNRIPIFRRVFIIFGIAVVIPAIVIILLGNFYLAALATRGNAVQLSFDSQNLASSQQVSLQRMNAQLQTLFNNVFASMSGSITHAQLAASGDLIATDMRNLKINFNQDLLVYQQQYEVATAPGMASIRTIVQTDSPNSKVIADQQHWVDQVARVDWPQYRQSQDEILASLTSLQDSINAGTTYTNDVLNSTFLTDYTIFFQTNDYYTTLRNDWQQVVDDAATIGKTVTAVGVSVTQPLLLATVIALLLSLLVVVTTGGIVNFTITSPLRRLASLTRRITRGDTNARANISGRDEIALVAQSMNSMLDNIVHLIQDANSKRENLQKQVEKLVSEVSGVGEGDLRIQAEVTADALGVLADSFNYMVEELGALVVRVKMVAQEVERSTLTTFDNMTHLVGVGDMQIKQITGAAIEVERMASFTRQVAERAHILETVAREAHQTAQIGRGAMQQTFEGMGRIKSYVDETSSKVQTLGESSQAIKSIIEVISRITHQTNRLALDAAIQAAMAGENGKGFGAVAADIRRLAAQAKDETNAITRIVRSVAEDISAVAISMQETERETSIGAQLTEEAGDSLSSIFGVVERQAQEIEAINRMADQQLQSSSTVVQVIRNVAGTTEQGSLSTREAAQNMERLARLAEQLLASVEAFKLREDLTYSSNAPMATYAQDAFDHESISGIFRAVTASAQIAPDPNSYPALAAVNSKPDAFGSALPPLPYPPDQRQGNGVPIGPMTRQGNGNGNGVPPTSSPWQGQGNGVPMGPMTRQGNGNGNGVPPTPSPWQGQGNGVPMGPMTRQGNGNGNGVPPTPSPWQGNSNRVPTGQMTQQQQQPQRNGNVVPPAPAQPRPPAQNTPPPQQDWDWQAQQDWPTNNGNPSTSPTPPWSR